MGRPVCSSETNNGGDMHRESEAVTLGSSPGGLRSHLWLLFIMGFLDEEHGTRTTSGRCWSHRWVTRGLLVVTTSVHPAGHPRALPLGITREWSRLCPPIPHHRIPSRPRRRPPVALPVVVWVVTLAAALLGDTSPVSMVTPFCMTTDCAKFDPMP